MGVSNGDEDSGGVDGDGSEGNSPSQQGAGTETSVPRNWSSMAAALRNFSWIEAYSFRVFMLGQFIGGRAMLEGARGAHTMWWRGQRWARATLWCGRLPTLLLLPFGLRLRVRKIGTLAFVPSNSENIFCITFLKYKNSRKLERALWHLVNMLVPENA
jgi:hypothetical protein